MKKDSLEDLWCHYSGMPSPSAYIQKEKEKEMSKNYDIILTKKVSLHLGEEALFYLIPTIGFQKLDWRVISKEDKITYLVVMKWLNWSAGINIKNKITK